MRSGPLRRLVHSRPLGVALGLGLTATLIWRIGPAQLGSTLARTNPALLAAAVVLNVPVVAVRSWRARLLLHRLGVAVPFRRVTAAQVIGLTLSGFTPAAAGDLVRAYLWNQQDSVPVSTGTVVVITERVSSLVLMALVGFSALAVEQGNRLLCAFLAAASLCLILPWFVARFDPGAGARLGALVVPRIKRIPRVGTLAGALERGADQVLVIARDLRLQGRIVLVSLLVFALSGTQVWLLALSLGQWLAALTALGAYCLSQVGGSLSGLPFGLGAADVLLVLVLVRADVPVQAATGVAILLRLATTVPIALVAAAAWAWTSGLSRATTVTGG